MKKVLNVKNVSLLVVEAGSKFVGLQTRSFVGMK